MRALNKFNRIRMPGITLHRLLNRRQNVEAFSAHVGYLTDYRDVVPAAVADAIAEQLDAANCKTVEGLVDILGRDEAVAYLRETPTLQAFMSNKLVLETPENLNPLDPDFDFL